MASKGRGRPAAEEGARPAGRRRAAALKTRVNKSGFARTARPDAFDARDLPFRPNVSVAPAPRRFPTLFPPIRNQGSTMACTGFGLAAVVEFLLMRAGREKAPSISPFMLYSMARRYDEYPGSIEDAGSSVRGALKGWFKHGACREELFPAEKMPPPAARAEADWWNDAVKRPLGAYYRVETHNITAMHAALNEVGILLASAECHAGWDEGIHQPARRSRPKDFKSIWTIPRRPGQADHPGHAFAIIGYDERGFLIQNSWGSAWGSHGWAILPYDDWLDHAMDCWVAQLGVVTTDHTLISRAPTLRTDRSSGRVVLAASQVLRDREISPFVVHVGRNGMLANSGEFRTRADDVRSLAEDQLPRARAAWGLGKKPVDVCIFAHGGLVGTREAAAIAAQWIPLLYERHILPVFVMWDSGFWQTLRNTIATALAEVGMTAATLAAQPRRLLNQRLERLLAQPGTALWTETKANARALSVYHAGEALAGQTGLVQLYQHFKHGVADHAVRLHFVGHSAGAIVVAWMLEHLASDALVPFASMSLLAPALSVDEFDARVRPHLARGTLGRYQQFHLSDRAENEDPTCAPYGRSLLYLVREAFEGGLSVPLMGLQVDFDAYVRRSRIAGLAAHLAPGPASAASTHGGFDDDRATRESVVRFIAGR